MAQSFKRAGVFTATLSSALLAAALMFGSQAALADDELPTTSDDAAIVAVADDATDETVAVDEAPADEATDQEKAEEAEATSESDAPATDAESEAAADKDEEAKDKEADEQAGAPGTTDWSGADAYDGRKYVIQTGVSNSLVLDVASAAKGGNVLAGAYNSASATQKWYLVPSTTEGYYFIYLDGTDFVLDVKGANGAAGANVQLWTKNGSDAQLWKVSGTNYITITSKLGESLGLGVKGGATAAGTNVELANIASKAQRFYLVDTKPTVTGTKTIEDGAYYITASAGSFVAETKDESLDKGANIQMGSKNYSAKQRMYFEYDGSGFYTITCVGTAKVLDLKGCGLVAGTNVQQWTRNNSDAQKWAVNSNSDGTYTIVNKASGLVLDISGGTAKAGANLQAYRNNGSAAQKFTFGPSESLADGIYTIHAVSLNSTVMDVPSASTASGTTMQLWSSNNSFAQRFQVVRLGRGLYRIRTAASGGWLTDDGGSLVQSGSSATAASDANTWQAVWNGSYYSLKNVATGRVIDLAGGSVAKGSKFQTRSASKATSQYFFFKPASLLQKGLYEISSLSKNLEVAGSSTSAGANIQVGAANNGSNQKFYVDPYGGGYRIRNAISNKVIAPTSATGSNVVQVTPSTSKLQVWIPSIADGGAVVFKNAQTGKALDIQNGAKGTNVQQWNANGSAAQQWKLKSTRLYGWFKVDGTWQFHYGGGTVKTFSNATHTAWDKIKNYSNKSSRTTHAGSKYLILINNDTCRTYVFQGKQGAWEPVFEWLCSVGTTSEIDPTFGVTARGDFYIRKKGYKMGWYPYEYYWSEFYINSAAAEESWGEGQRFHSVLKKGGPNSEDWDARLGLKCTHGCVRLATANAKWIYDTCPLYTRVISY